MQPSLRIRSMSARKFVPAFTALPRCTAFHQSRYMSSGEIRASEATFSAGRSRSCGIVGMPNVGKSTLFNALTSTQKAEAANYPFCTIEPNLGRVSVPDDRLKKIAELGKSQKIVGSQLEFVDIAGLVRGASEGAGLGNKFLANIREVSVIVQLIRCFDDTEDKLITHVEGSIDPVRDFDTIEMEMMLADIQSLAKFTGKTRLKADSPVDKQLVDRVMAELDAGRPARDMMLSVEEVKGFRELRLLSAKPLLLVCNVDESGLRENTHVKKLLEHLQHRGDKKNPIVPLTVCSTLEQELSMMGEDEEGKQELLQEYGLEDTGLSRIIKASNDRLGLGTFYTVGPQEARAWSFPLGYTAPQAAAIIHSDMQRGFIRAETTAFSDFVEHGGEEGAKKAGKFRLEGKEYVVQDGDVLTFRFNV